MKEFFRDVIFHAKTRAIIAKANEILASYSAQGYKLTLRQLYYQFVSQNLIANTERNYKNLGQAISDGRIAGLIDWDMIEDRGRETQENAHWENPADILDSCALSFRYDLWKDQPNRVEVMVEKQALEGVLISVCRSLDIPFSANKGYASSSALYDSSKRMLRYIYKGQKIHVLYLGDHDPSGIDMSRDIEDRFKMFLTDEADSLIIHRIALNLDQIKKLKPPENPAKITDSRAKGYIRTYGRHSWELDAIEPRALEKLVTDNVIDLRDEDKWREAVSRQGKTRKLLSYVGDNLERIEEDFDNKE